MATGGHDEAILNSSNIPLARFNKYISSVCYLVLAESGNSVQRKASGFLAKFSLNGSEKIVVVMNNHFIATKQEACLVIATFHFDGNNEYKMVKLNPEIFFRTNKEFDYTFVGISQLDVNELHQKHGVIPVRLEQALLAVKPDDIIHIPQHAEGRQKSISFSKVCSITESEVFYEADTSFGSSGSPVLCTQSKDMHVLALHKSGGVILPDGRQANRGILISAILAHICQHSDDDERPSSYTNERASSSGNRESEAYAPFPMTNQGLPVIQSQSKDNMSVENSEYGKVQSNVNDGASSSGKQESGVYLNPTTNQGQPVVQPHTDMSVENSDAPSSSAKQAEYAPCCAKSSHLKSRGFPAEPRPAMLVPATQAVQPVCRSPFESRELIRIAQRIASVWKIVAKQTNLFKDWEIDNISGDYTLSDPVSKADRMLNGFKSRLGEREVLVVAIDDSGKPDIARKVRSGFYISNTD